MKLEDFLVMISRKLLVMEFLKNTLPYTTPFKNSEKFVKNHALIYLSIFGVYHINSIQDCQV